MKKILTLLLVVVAWLITGNVALAQAEVPDNYSIPFKPGNTLKLYGTDVVINNQPTENQRNACLKVAFNGWLFAIYACQEGSVFSWKLMKSTDDGATWTILRDQSLNANWYTVSIDLAVCGTTLGDLTIFIARIYQNDVSSYSELIASKYDPNTGTNLGTIRDNLVTIPEKFLDVSLASDYLYPSYGSSPYSLALLYSKTIPARDSIILWTSSNGGTHFDTEKLVTTTLNYTRKVDLDYGHSNSFFNGRCFAVWEERISSSGDLGYIYTAHTTPYFNSDFTTPIELDNLLSHSQGFCRNPAISCQFCGVDNSMANLTEVVLFDRAYDGNTSTFNIVGTYNLEAVGTDNWSIFGLYASLSHSDYESDISFDPGYNNFLATYFNSTSQKLRYVVEGMNMPDPYNWVVVSDQYNSATNLVDPYPKVEINPIYLQVAHVWNGERAGGNGMTLFDAEYSTVGIQPPVTSSEFNLNVAPNPASTTTQFSFDLQSQAQVTITLVNVYGQTVRTILDGTLAAGRHIIPADVSGLSAGCYIYRVTAGHDHASGRLVIL